MTKQYTEWRQEHVNTAGQTYGTANSMYHDGPEFEQRTINAIANLATATASDRATVAKLTSTISELTLELKTTQAKLVAALELNANLAKSSGKPTSAQQTTSIASTQCVPKLI